MPNPKQPTVAAVLGKTTAERYAAYTLIPEMNSAGIAEVFSIHQKPDYLELMGELLKRGDDIVKGDTNGIERMLIAQAHALDSMFANLARRAKNQENLAPLEAFLKLALKAQSQCRATLETLATIKNPPHVAFVKQANIAHGPQQVNNGVASEPAREEKTIPQTELLENDHGQRMDTGTASTAGRGDPIMATVGTVDRAAHGRRKSLGKP